jgi:hypothetical protein
MEKVTISLMPSKTWKKLGIFIRKNIQLIKTYQSSKISAVLQIKQQVPPILRAQSIVKLSSPEFYSIITLIFHFSNTAPFDLL